MSTEGPPRERRIPGEEMRRLILEWLEVQHPSELSFAAADVARGIDYVLVSQNDERIANRDSVRTQLDELTKRGHVFSREALESERPASVRGRMFMYSDHRLVPETPLTKREVVLSHLPPPRQSVIKRAKRREHSREHTKSPSRVNSTKHERAEVLISLIRELATDADEVPILRSRLQKLDIVLKNITRERDALSTRVDELSAQVKRNEKFIERARKLLQGLVE